MDTTNFINLIKESFERWYNQNIFTPAAIVINYRDTQTLAIKAYHTATIEMEAVKVENEKTVCVPLISMSENYNHGIISEEEAKSSMVRKLLEKLYSYKE